MSNETKWTKGPWAVCDKDHGSGWGIDGPEGEAVVWWPASDEPENGIPLEPDAHLIAAAPDGAALAELVMELCGNPKGLSEAQQGELYETALQFMKKARGRHHEHSEV